MKIAFFVRSLPPTVDGVGHYTWHLARALQELGVDTHIFTSQDQKHHFGAPWIHAIIDHWTPKALSRMIDEMGLSGFDWCSFQYVPQMYGRAGICLRAVQIPAMLRRKLKCRVSVTFHEVSVAWKPALKNIVLAAVMHLQAKILLKSSDLIITTQGRYQKMLQNLADEAGRQKIKVIPVGSNIIPEFAPDRVAGLRKKYGFGEDKILGIFGRLTSSRNFALALRILEKTKRLGLNVRLLVIGWAEHSNQKLFSDFQIAANRLKLEGSIRITGVLSDKALSYHLQLVDLFLSLEQEGISTGSGTLMAALCHNLEVLAFRPLPDNFIEDMIPQAILADRGQEEQFVNQAVEYLDPESSKIPAPPNKTYYEAHFAWPEIAGQYVNAFSEANSQSGRRTAR